MSRAVLVLPAYNEADDLPSLLESVAPVFEGLKDVDASVLVVDDGSDDKTVEIAQSFASRLPLRVLARIIRDEIERDTLCC